MKRYTRKNKKHKKYSTNYFLLFLRLLVFVAILESYFLYQYFRSDKFLVTSINMINEASTIADRNFANFLLYQVFLDILATNGTSMVFNQNSTVFILNYIGQFNTDLQNFLSVHAGNTAIYDDNFNSFFNSLIYTSVCDTVKNSLTTAQKVECPTYVGGIL